MSANARLGDTGIDPANVSAANPISALEGTYPATENDAQSLDCMAVTPLCASHRGYIFTSAL
jgi:hypothetical protein